MKGGWVREEKAIFQLKSTSFFMVRYYHRRTWRALIPTSGIHNGHFRISGQLHINAQKMECSWCFCWSENYKWYRWGSILAIGNNYFPTVVVVHKLVWAWTCTGTYCENRQIRCNLPNSSCFSWACHRLWRWGSSIAYHLSGSSLFLLFWMNCWICRNTNNRYVSIRFNISPVVAA